MKNTKEEVQNEYDKRGVYVVGGGEWEKRIVCSRRNGRRWS